MVLINVVWLLISTSSVVLRILASYHLPTLSKPSLINGDLTWP